MDAATLARARRFVFIVSRFQAIHAMLKK